jgi:hypothetical protein
MNRIFVFNSFVAKVQQTVQGFAYPPIPIEQNDEIRRENVN